MSGPLDFTAHAARFGPRPKADDDTTTMSDTETSSSEPPSSSDRPCADDDSPGRQPAADTGCTFDLLDKKNLLDAPLRSALTGQVRAALDCVRAKGEIRVDIVDDAAMSHAHMEYLEIEGTTDVLTFDLANGGSADGMPLDVDIMICLDEAARQAHKLGHPVEHEMTLYIIHGVLHCLGYDDITEAGAARMHAEEDRLLTAAGIGAVFHAARGPDGEDAGAGGGS